MNFFQYTEAKTTRDAIKAKQEKEASYFIAGGSNLVDMMKEGIQHPQQLVDINTISGLREIKNTGDTVYLGTLASNTVAAESEKIINFAPLVSQSIVKGATQQIRNMATIGGNLMQESRCPFFYDVSASCGRRTVGDVCPTVTAKDGIRTNALFGLNESCNTPHPSDMAVGMLALRSKVVLQSKNDTRKLTLDKFYHIPVKENTKITHLQDGEMIVGVEIPLEHGFNHSAYLKVRDRKSYAFALISGAAALNIQTGTILNAGLASGWVGTIPWRFEEAENFLQGKAATESNFRQAAKIAVGNAQPKKNNAFKVKLLEKILIRTLLMAKETPYGTNN